MSADPPATQAVEKPDWVDVLLAATLAAWGVIATVMALVSLAVIVSGPRPGDLVGWVAMMLPTLLFGFQLAAITCVVVGLPALGLVYWLKLTSWWQWTVIGAAGGLLVSLVLPLNVQIDLASLTAAAAMFGVAGALAGFAAWREDRKANRP